MSKVWRFLLVSLLIGLGARVAYAQGPDTPAEDTSQAEPAGIVRLSETALTYAGTVNEPGQRTFTLIVQDTTVTNLSFVINDLVDTTTGTVLVSSAVTLNPAQVDSLSQPQSFTVSINGTKEGHFQGEIELLYDERPADQPLTLPLDVTLELTPNVDAGINSKSLTLSVNPGILSTPFGRPNVVTDDPPLSNVTLTLLQSGKGEATVQSATVLTMRGTKGETLPQDAVSVTTALPLLLQSQEAKTVEVVVAGRNLPADEYNGILHITVRNQDTAIQIPLTIKVKDGPLLPILLLLIGPILGLAINWWNNGGQARYKLLKDMERLEAQLAAHDHLQQDQQAAIGDKLRKAQDKLLAGAPAGDLETLVKQVQTDIDAAMDASVQFLRQELVPVREGVDQLKGMETYERKLLAVLDAIESDARIGELLSLGSARASLGEVKGNLETAQKMVTEMAGLPASTAAEIAGKVNNAASLAEIQQIISEAQAATRISDEGFIEEAHGVGVGPATPVAELAMSLNRRESALRRVALGLQWGRLGLMLAVFLFTLLVGYITLYANAPTFGANREDYITILLWGVGTNLIGAQTINLSSIYNKKEAGGE
ncbi:MAG: hypothetical protein KC418_19400 [Anaerolineales bacterium]|nr:hypothetical protein [Anaerolineales bacterium]MCB8952518.1 hypothetical protein [Ardenticatenales bacterium]